MAAKNLTVNQNIELEINEGPYQGRYMSKISNITEEEITVMAVYDGELLPLRKNLPINVYFYGEHAVYRFKSSIKARVRNPIPMLVLIYPEKAERIQRRQYFRLKINEKVYYRFADNEQQANDYKETRIIDISGGGIKLVLNTELKMGDKLQFFIDIKPLQDILFTGKVVRITKLADRNTKAAGIKFINIKRNIQDKIISWIFEYQSKLRRRGML